MRAFFLASAFALTLAAGWASPARAPAPAAAPARTDNRQRTALEVAVHWAAAAYMQQPAAVGLSIALYKNGKQYFYSYGEVAQGSGLRDTRRVLSAAEQARYATGYETPGRSQAHPNYTGYWGGTTLSSTPADLLRYARANLAERDPAVRLAHQPTTTLPEGYAVGLGWRLDADATGSRRIYHSGHFPGYNTWLAVYPGLDAAVVLLVNDNLSQDRLTELGQRLKLALLAGAAQ